MQDVGLPTRMGRDPYAEISATRATGAMGGRVLQIQRTFREPNENLPEPAAILAQLEAPYGPPSRRTSEGATWTWGEEGFIADLDGQPMHEITTHSQSGSRKTIQYRPCSTGFSADAEYRFRQHRDTPIMPGCVALFNSATEAALSSRPSAFR